MYKTAHKKLVAAFIARVTAPKGRLMGHARVIVFGRSGTSESKTAALQDAGVATEETLSKIAETLFSIYK
jgi:succinyl-CoA synthetase alpha subunit